LPSDIVRPILSEKRIPFVTHWLFQGKSVTADAVWLTPGTFVRSPANPDWGLGQVQSVVGGKATVNFEHRGKLVLQLSAVSLTIVHPSELGKA
jgi:hypothetical protein